MADCVRCNLCGEGTLESAQEILSVPCCVERFKDEEFTVWRCSQCGSLHAKEEVNLPLYYEHYPFKNHKLDYHTRVAYKNRLRMLRSQGVTPEDAVLDYGCGAGLFVDFLRSAGFKRVEGYDPFIPRFSDPAILKRSFDVVTSYDVIEHVDDAKSYLSALLAPLKLGGLLVLGTPNADYIPLKADPFYPVELSQPYHRHIFSEKELLRIANEAGLEPLHVFRRFYFDSLYPLVNTRFMWQYVNELGGFLDVCVQPMKLKTIFSSPKLLLYAVLGYFLPERGNVLVNFRKVRISKEEGDFSRTGQAA